MNDVKFLFKIYEKKLVSIIFVVLRDISFHFIDSCKLFLEYFIISFFLNLLIVLFNIVLFLY
jgi:hypothetical protein